MQNSRPTDMSNTIRKALKGLDNNTLRETRNLILSLIKYLSFTFPVTQTSCSSSFASIYYGERNDINKKYYSNYSLQIIVLFIPSYLL